MAAGLLLSFFDRLQPGRLIMVPMLPRPVIAGIIAAGLFAPVRAAEPVARIAQILYFKAKPGKFEDYNKYIREIADPIDEAARMDGAFVSLSRAQVFPDEKRRRESTPRSASLRDRVGEPVVADILH
jgi:hypothetical protein